MGLRSVLVDEIVSTTLMPATEGEALNETNVTMSTSFIFKPVGFAISGVFVWSALLLTCFQVREGLKLYLQYTKPKTLMAICLSRFSNI